MSLLMIGNFFPTIGSRQVCQDLAEKIPSKGYPVYTSSHYQNRILRLLDMLYTVWHRRHDYDLAQVDVFSGMAFLWAEVVVYFLHWLKKPIILSLHGGNLPEFSRKHPQRIRKLLQRANVVTTPSRFLQEAMQSYRADLTLLPNPIELSQYDFSLRSQARPRLVWLRAFAKIYQTELAAEVLHLLKDEFPEISLTMIGPDKGEGSLESFQETVKRLNLSDHVEILGGVAKADVPQYLQSGDIFLNTTTVDNTPTSVIEAMACGLVVVSTNVGGIPYLLDDENDALLVPPNDAQAMAKAVRRILTSPDLAEKLSRNGRAKAEQFDSRSVLDQWKALIRQTASAN